MDTLSVKVPDDLAERVEAYADAHTDGNTSAAVRELLNQGLAAEQIEADNERLQNHLQTLIAEREEKQELVEYVETERELERARVEAPVWQRAKWWVFGRSED
jgi:metal-responsive CopG/Arc/MetJ family transcriptional regulator